MFVSNTKNLKLSLLPVDFTLGQITVSSVKSVGFSCLLSVGLFLIRSHLSVATVALVLIIPVVYGVISGGFVAGIVATLTGFLIYDYFFIPPYYTLSVGAAQNWAALGVYVVVMLTLSQMVTRINLAKLEAQKRVKENRELFDLSELLIKDISVEELSRQVLASLKEYFKLITVGLFLEQGGKLVLVGCVGNPLTADEIENISNKSINPISLESSQTEKDELHVMALVSPGSTMGLLAVKGLSKIKENRELFKAFTNHLSYALERTLLKDQAMKTELLQKADELKNSLVGAVSHDLRTPLSTIKISSSAIIESGFNLSIEEIKELVELIDLQASKLDNLVGNLLDVTRIESGTLILKKEYISTDLIVSDLIESFKFQTESSRIEVQNEIPNRLVFVDKVLVTQALVNLVDNALKYSPEDKSVILKVIKNENRQIEFRIRDFGSGFKKPIEFDYINLFNKNHSGGRGGLGLAIALIFIKSNGGQISSNNNVKNGAEIRVILEDAETKDG